MKPTSTSTEKPSTPYTPQTDQEKAEAFKLHDALLDELAKEDALRTEIADKILADSSS